MRWAVLTAVTILFGMALNAYGSGPTALEALKERQHSIERAQEALANAPGDSASKQALDRAIREAFDFDKLARESIGDHWNQMSAPQREEYLRLFCSLVLRSTTRKLEQYRAAGTEYASVDTNGTGAVITTIVTSTGGDRVAIQYKLHRVNSRWWVWDTMIGLDTEITEYDVSTADNYRSAFNKLVGDEGIEGLLAKLREKEQGGSEF